MAGPQEWAWVLHLPGAPSSSLILRTTSTTKDTKGARSYKWKLLVRPLCPSWLFLYWLGAPLRESGFANGLHRAIAPTNGERPNSPRTRVYFPRTALISSSLEGSTWAPPEDQP